MQAEPDATARDPAVLAGRDLAFLVGINLIWGLNYIASKIGVGQIPPILFTALRFSALGLCLIPFLKVHRGQMLNVLAAAALTGAASFALLFVGVSLTTDASTVAIAAQMGVPFSTLLSVWLLGEVIRWRRTLGILLAFAGIAIISFDPHVLAYGRGLAFVVASCFVSSLGLIFVKRLKNIRALELQAWLALTGGPVLLLTSFAFESHQIEAIRNVNWQGWSALFFTTAMSSLVAHTGWYYLVSRYPVTSLSPLTLLSPLFGIFFGVALLDEHLTSRMVLGSAITLVGVFIVVKREQRLVDTGT
jgi:O-acetylserine/cysteine efflux transporter